MKTTRLGEQVGPDEDVAAHGFIQMRLHENAQGHLMRVLTSLYPDPVLATLREYSSNALDSHERAGQRRPIEVTFPKQEVAGNLVIEDFGLGMNREDLSNYAAYGFSDKMDTNEERGGFGLGSKSALALKRAFLVDTVKDGTRILAKVHAEGRNAGVFELLANEPSDRVNGTRITVPLAVEQVKHLQDLAANFFHYQAEGSVKVNGEVVKNTVYGPEYLTVKSVDEALGWVKFSERPVHVEGQSRRGYVSPSSRFRLRAVVGGIVYDLPREQSFQVQENAYGFRDQEAKNYLRDVDAKYRRFMASNPELYFVLPIGSVKFVSSRDSIELNEENKAVIVRAAKRFFDMIEPDANVYLQGLSSRADAARFYGENWALFEPNTQFRVGVSNQGYYGYGQTKGRISATQEKPPVWRGDTMPVEIALPDFDPTRFGTTQESWVKIESYWQKAQSTEQAKHFPVFRASRGEVTYSRGQQKYGPEDLVIIRTDKDPNEVLDKVKNNIRIFGQYRYESRNVTAYLTNAAVVNPWVEATAEVTTYAEFLAEVAEAREAAKSGRIKKARPNLKYTVLDKTNYNTRQVSEKVVLDIAAGLPYIAEEDCQRTMVATFWQDLRSGRTIDANDARQALLYRTANGGAVLLPSSRSEANLHKQLPANPSMAALVWDEFRDANLPNAKRKSILALARVIQDSASLAKFTHLVDIFAVSDFANPVVREAAQIVKLRERTSAADYALAERVALMLPGMHKHGATGEQGHLLVDTTDFVASLQMLNPYGHSSIHTLEGKALSVINFLHPAK